MAVEKVLNRCVICGTVSEFPVPLDWKNAEIENLDGKPFETGEVSIANGVCRCPKCGYVSFDISRNILKNPALMGSHEYREILNNKAMPNVVNNYLALGYIFEKQEEHYHSSHAYLSAGWLLESYNMASEAKTVLEKTAFCMLIYINSPEFKNKPNFDLLLSAVDVLRRIEKYDNAKKLAEFALAKAEGEDLKEKFLLEISLCDNYISTPHKIKPEKRIAEEDFEKLVELIADSRNRKNTEKLDLLSDSRVFFASSAVLKLKDGLYVLACSPKLQEISAEEELEKVKIAYEKKNFFVNVEKDKGSDSAYVEEKQAAPQVLSKLTDVLKPVEETEVSDEKTVDDKGDEEQISVVDDVILVNSSDSIEPILAERGVEDENEGENESSILDEIQEFENLVVDEETTENEQDEADVISDRELTVEEISEESSAIDELVEFETLIIEDDSEEEVADSAFSSEGVDLVEDMKDEEIVEVQEVADEIIQADEEIHVEKESAEVNLPCVDEPVEDFDKEQPESMADIEEEEDFDFSEFENVDMEATTPIFFGYEDVEIPDLKDAKEESETYVEIEEDVDSIEIDESFQSILNDTEVSGEEIAEDIILDNEKAEDSEAINGSFEKSVEFVEVNEAGKEDFSEDEGLTLKDKRRIEEEYEENVNAILLLAELDGKINIADVQSLFDIGYVKAKEMLLDIQKRGYLERSDDEDEYLFVKGK